jgi:ABC-type molybdate transport system ATPase subunit
MVFTEAHAMSLVLQGIRFPLAPFTLEVEAACSGPVTALFGPSGSGKTSLLEVIAGLRLPVAGRITLGETVLLDTAAGIALKPQQRMIGYVPQEGASVSGKTCFMVTPCTPPHVRDSPSNTWRRFWRSDH